MSPRHNHRWEEMLEQTTAKQLFMNTLTRLNALLDPHQTGLNELVDHAEQPAVDESLYYSGILDALGEHLWGCHDVIDAPASALSVIGCNLGTTYHEAVLHRALAVINSGVLSLLEQTWPRHPGSSSLLVSRSGIEGYRGKISDYGSYTAYAYHCLAPTIWRCPPHRGHHGASIYTAPADGDGANCRLPPLCHVVIVRP
jgi:hypothetical protein